MKLDLRDKKLLFELDLNARQSLGELGRKLRISKRGADYKIKKLEREGIIGGYHAIINSSKLNYYYFRLLISFNTLDEKTEREFNDFIKRSHNFAYVYRCQGTYDYACAVWVKDIVGLKRISDEIKFRWQSYIKEVKEHITFSIKHLQNRFLLNIHSTKEIVLGWPVEDIKLDELEKSIIKILSNEARTPIYEIAEKLKENPKKIAYRIKKLEREKIILAYRAVIDYKKLGYSYFKTMIEVKNVSKEELNRIKDKIIKTPQIIFINEGIGFPEIDISGIFLTINDFYVFIENLKSEFPGKIGNYEVLIFGDVIKYNYVPFI